MMKTQRKLQKTIIGLQVFLQLTVPLYSWLPGIVHAAASNEPDQETRLRLDEAGDLAMARSPFLVDRINSKIKQNDKFPESQDGKQIAATGGNGKPLTLPNLGSPDANVSSHSLPGNEQQQFSDWGQNMGTVARIASADDSGAAARGFAVGGVTGYTTGAVQNWLQQFGTAKVDISVDDNMTFSDSSLDFLYPIYDSASRIFYTQAGFRYSDDRWMSNLGIGQRHFVGKWMLGYNLFFDHDLSEGHSRAGTGLELWRDYLKLSSNGYFHLTDWKDSSQIEHYEARPADGFDIKAEGYLPPYPQLGGLIGFEQYYGDDVALFGHDNDRQKNPSAFSYGLTYTPVSLVELNATYKDGDGGQSETQFGLQFNYAFGVPLSSQVDPADVALKRSLAGSRYDLVNRNNTIVLDYRNNGKIRLSLPETLSGKGNTSINLQAMVQSDNGLDHIAWDDSVLRAAGGSIMGSGTQYTVHLPPYVPGSTNTYMLSGIAFDKEGHTSSAASTAIGVLTSSIDPNHVQVSANPSTLKADGTSTATLTMSLEDGQGNPLTGQSGGFTFNLSGSATQPAVAAKAKLARAAFGASKAAAIGSVREVSPGKYQATITAGTQSGSLIVTPSLNGSALPTATLTLTADSSDASLKSGSLHLLINNSTADGKTQNVAEVTVVDENQNPVPNVSVDWTLPAGNTTAKLTSTSSVTDASGVAQTGITDTTAETISLSATINNSSLSTDVTFTQSNDSAGIKTDSFTVKDASTTADGVTTKTASLKVVDGSDNPLKGIKVSWVVDGSALFSGGSATTSTVSGEDGTASITLTDKKAETVKVTAVVNGNSQSLTSVYVADSSKPVLNTGSLIITKDASKADGVAANQAQVTVVDSQGNPVSSASVTWTLQSGSSAVLSAGSSTSTSEGIATVSVTDKVAENVTIIATLGSSTLNKGMSFTQDNGTAVIKVDSFTVADDSTPADGTTVKTASLVVVDGNGTPLKNVQVAWAVNGGALLSSGAPTANSASGSDGVASVTLTDTKAEQVTVSATVNNQSQSKTSQFTANDSTAVVTRVVSSQNNSIADGSSQNSAAAIVLDAGNNPVPNTDVTWTSSSSTVAFDQGNNKTTTNQYGIATIKFADTTAGSQTLTATLGNGKTGSVTSSFAANPANISVASVELVSPTGGAKVLNDGASAYTYKAKVVDNNSNPIGGQGITWSLSGSAKFVGNISQSTTGSDGYAQISFTDTAVEKVTLTATLANGSAKNTGNVIEFVSHYSISVAMDRSSALAWDTIGTSDTTQYVDATFTVMDNTTNQPASGQLLSITGSATAYDKTAPTTDSSGKAVVKAVATKAGNQTIKATLGADTSINTQGSWTINPNPNVLGSLGTMNVDGGNWVRDFTMCQDFTATGIVDKWNNGFVNSAGGKVNAVVTGMDDDEANGPGSAGFNGRPGQGGDSGDVGTTPLLLSINTADGSISSNLCLKGTDSETPGNHYRVSTTLGGVAYTFNFN